MTSQEKLQELRNWVHEEFFREQHHEFADLVENVKEDYGNWQSWCVKEVAGMGWGDWLHTNRNELDDLPHDGWVEEVLLDKEKHIKAIYDGYTVKPKRWVVKFKQQNEQFYFIGWMNSYSTLPTVTGDTYTVNFLQAMLTKLDVEFGTKYEKTASQFKQEAVVEVEQGTLFEEGEG